MFNTGRTIRSLGRFYARAIRNEIGDNFDVVFGPAYKGIPLAVATASALAEDGLDKGYAFDRKEAKDHGEMESVVGYKITDGSRIIIVDDVITSGKSIKYSIEFLKNLADVDIVSVFISIDRQEKGLSGKSATKEIYETYGVSTKSIATIRDVVDYLCKRRIGGKIYLDDIAKRKMETYFAKNGTE